MIIGKNFIWLHFPKCAGTFTENLLKKYFSADPSILFDPITPEAVIWHQTIAQREKLWQTSLTGKDIICNFRRLPQWIISRVSFESKRSEFNVSREMLAEGKFFEMSGKQSSADKYVERYTERTVNHWIRMEFIENDFRTAFSNYLDVKSTVKSVDFQEKINVSSENDSVANLFTDAELLRLYQSNPKWANLEKELYGNLTNDLMV